MLVIGRRERESIVIPELDVTITLVDVSNKRVRIGIDAPRHITIVRKEISDCDTTRNDSRSRGHKQLSNLRGGKVAED